MTFSRHSHVSPVIFAVVLGIAGAACNKSSSTDQQSVSGAEAMAAPAAAPGPAAEARKMFRTICASCHGTDGKGDGPGAAALNPKPRNYSDVTWQGSVTDDDIKKTILMGGAAVGKSASMPAQPQLQSKPLVLDELVKIIRGFKGK
jgi:mono/diheme cytochrome c family protein